MRNVGHLLWLRDDGLDRQTDFLFFPSRPQHVLNAANVPIAGFYGISRGKCWIKTRKKTAISVLIMLLIASVTGNYFKGYSGVCLDIFSPGNYH